jgi:allantoinase
MSTPAHLVATSGEDMPYDLLVADARVVTPQGVVSGSVAVADGRIALVVEGSRRPEAHAVIEAQQRHLFPGVVDIHVHFREPGQEYKATYRSESSAAAAGGVTTICDMPNNGARAVVDRPRVEAKRAIAAASSFVDFGIYAFLVSSDVGELRDLVDAGVMGFKWDMSFAGVEVAPGRRLPEPQEALPYFRAAAQAGARIGVHAEDRPFVATLTEALRHAGRLDARAHVEARPVEAETRALRQAIDLAHASGAHLHVHHLSSAAGVALVRDAKAQGMRITAETIPPFLFLDADDYARLGTVMKIHPAVKYAEDREALWDALRDGTIDCVATDHAPHTAEEKRRGVWEASPGAIGVQTSLPLLLTAVSDGRLTLERCAEVLAAAPARIYGLDGRKGAIVPGADADLVLVDTAAMGIIANEAMYSPNHLTPFDGWHITGMPVLTMLRGHIVARDGRVVGEPRGAMLRPAPLPARL